MTDHPQPFRGETRHGCVGSLLLYGVVGIWFVLSAFLILVVPKSLLIGFCWGVVTTVVMASFLQWGVTRSPSIMVAHKQMTRVFPNDQEKQRQYELGFQQHWLFPHLVRAFPMTVMIVLGVGTLYFLGLVISLGRGGDPWPNMTGGSMGFGSLLTATLGWWKFGLRHKDDE